MRMGRERDSVAFAWTGTPLAQHTPPHAAYTARTPPLQIWHIWPICSLADLLSY